MITNVQAQNKLMIPGLRKAAILLVSLGDQASGEILRQLEEDEVQIVSREVARLSAITSEQSEAVLEEFNQMAIAQLAWSPRWHDPALRRWAKIWLLPAPTGSAHSSGKGTG